MTTSGATEALKAAHHALTAVAGLYAHDNPRPDIEGSELWQLDETETINQIEQALAVSERPLSERIEAAYDELIAQQAKILDAEIEIEAESRLHDARASFALEALEIKRLRLLVELAKTGGDC